MSRQRSILGSTSRNSFPSSVNHDSISSELKAGARAQVQGKIGTIRFVGTTSFQTGKWVGIELDDANGKNSGVVQGKRYFECKTNHGVFARPSQVKVLGNEEDEHDDIQPPSPSLSEQRRFAPAQDPNLAAARTIQQHTPSSSSTLLPSRIISPSRISRLPNVNSRKSVATGLVTAGSRKSASPKASITATSRKSKITSPTTTRPRSNTNTQKDAKENKLLQLKMQQQEKLSFLHKQQQLLLQQQLLEQQQQQEEEEDAELQRQLQEEEELAFQDQQQQQEEDEDDDDYDEDDEEEDDDDNQDHQTMYETESTETSSDRGVGLVSTTSSTAMPRPSSHQQQPQQQSYGSLAANLPISKSDQMIPLKDYEELRLKLKILESKRQEDRERYREHEKVKEEAEQFLTLRNKLQDKIADLQKELRDTKRQLKESSTDQEMYESKYNDVIESLEMMTLDKEVAEERAENLQQEVNVLNDKIEEISVDLDILKKEADIINRVPDRDGEEKTPLEVIQLERHNERLKEALLK
jgi:dynactin 1